MTNTMIEGMPSDTTSGETVSGALTSAHFARLRSGFEAAIRRSCRAGDAAGIALMLAVFAQGLFVFSRVTGDPGELRTAARSVLDTIERHCRADEPEEDRNGPRHR